VAKNRRVGSFLGFFENRKDIGYSSE